MTVVFALELDHGERRGYKAKNAQSVYERERKCEEGKDRRKRKPDCLELQCPVQFAGCALHTHIKSKAVPAVGGLG